MAKKTTPKKTTPKPKTKKETSEDVLARNNAKAIDAMRKSAAAPKPEPKAKTVTMTVPKAKPAAEPKAKKAKGILPSTDTSKVRGRKKGTLGFKWVKDYKADEWPSKLETNIILAMKKVGNGTSGDVMMVAEKTGLDDDLTRQDHNKVVCHVLGKLLKAGIIARTDAKVKAKPAAEPKAKKAKKAKKAVKMDVAVAAPEVAAQA
jgi:hypothetical protein